jgi:hypothetical protein
MEVSGQLHVPATLPPGKNPGTTLNKRLGGAHSRFRRFGEQKYLLPLMGFETLTIHPVVWSLCPPSYTRLHYFFIFYHICFQLISNLYVVRKCLGVMSLPWRSIQKALCWLEHWWGDKQCIHSRVAQTSRVKEITTKYSCLQVNSNTLVKLSFFFMKNIG